MCGRYAVNRDAYEHYVRLADAYIDEAVKADTRGHYNAAPTQLLPIVYEVAGIPHVRLAKWGLVPYFSKTRDYKNAKGQRYNTINARMETVATSRTYKNYYKGQRCLVPALGFYEWKVEEGGKQPYFFTVRGKPLTFGGLWSEWKPPEGSTEDPLLSFTIIVGEPNPLVGDVHRRMPLIIDERDRAAWMDPANGQPDALLKPYPHERMNVWPVDKAVGNVRSQGPKLIEPIGEEVKLAA